jgi:hypothetical protein
MKPTIRSLSLFAYFMLAFAYISYAPPIPPDPTVPIDGGIGLLVLAGIVYGATQYNKRRKK